MNNPVVSHKINFKSVSATVWISKNLMTIWISGTNEFKDLGVTLNNFPWERVHRGCDNAADGLKWLIEDLDGYWPGIPCHISGHSMGASVAERLSEKLCSKLSRLYAPYGTSKNPPPNLIKFRCGHDVVTMLFPWYSNVIDKTYDSKDEPSSDERAKYSPLRLLDAALRAIEDHKSGYPLTWAKALLVTAHDCNDYDGEYEKYLSGLSGVEG